jgi:hypothetical protein
MTYVLSKYICLIFITWDKRHTQMFVFAKSPPPPHPTIDNRKLFEFFHNYNI